MARLLTRVAALTQFTRGFAPLSPLKFVAFPMFRHASTGAAGGNLTIRDGPRDRVLVFVNNERVAIVDSRVENQPDVNLNLQSGDVTDLLVDNYGRVNFGDKIPDQRKGIVGDIYVGDANIQPIDQYQLSCNQPWEANNASLPSDLVSSNPPAWCKGTFDMETPGDTFLELPGPDVLLT